MALRADAGLDHGSRVLPLEDYFKWIQPHCYTYTNAVGDTFGYAYDANGNLTQLTLPDGKLIHYAYDNRDRLTSVTDWAGRVTTIV